MRCHPVPPSPSPQGVIVVELYDKHAPLACQNFVGLAQRGYYNGTKFHRIIRVRDAGGCGEGGPRLSLLPASSPWA